MRCPIETRDNAELLLAYTARRLDPDTAATLDRHMEVCPSCREFAENQRAVWGALDAWEAMPLTPDFNRRLYQRIEQQGSWWDRIVKPFQPMLVRQGLPIAAAACLVVMAGILLERPGTVTPPQEQQVQIETVQADQVENALEDIELLREFHQKVRGDASSQTKM